jgi:dihydroorotate dehydrogenase
MLDAGADLIQLYTGYIYQGPWFVKKIQKALVKLRRRQDYRPNNSQQD